MTLKTKMSLIMLVVAVVMAVASAGVLKLTILPSFEALEMREASRNTQRLERTLQAEASALGRAVNDWSKWDEMAAFAEGDNPDFPAINITVEVLQDLKVDFMIVLDARGNLVYESMVNEGALRACLTTKYYRRLWHRHAGRGGSERVRRRLQPPSRAVRGCGSGGGSGWWRCQRWPRCASGAAAGRSL
jgi:sensor domain CHASE-containing protein